MTATIPWLHRVIVQPTLTFMAEGSGKPWIASKEAQAILLGTAAVESDLRWTRQLNEGVARGMFQCEPSTAYDVIKRRWKMMPTVIESFLADDVPLHTERFLQAMQHNQSLSCLIARLKYMDASPALPDWHDVAGQEAYHKRYYNSMLGATKPDDYVRAFARHGILSYMEGEFGAVEA